MIDNTVIMQINIFIAIICLTFSGLALILGSIAYCKVMAMSLSTHSVQYMPMDPTVDSDNEEFIEKQRGTGWATGTESMDEQNKMFKEDVEDLMPEFGVEEDEKKIYSF